MDNPHRVTILNSKPYTEILVDDREGYRKDECLEYWGEQCSVHHLDYADISYMGNQVGIEIKEADDFISSTTSRRVFRQATELSKNFEHSYVIIIGDIDKAIKKNNAVMKKKKWRTRFYKQNYLSAIASLSQIVVPIHVDTMREAILFMDTAFVKCTDCKRRDLSPPEFKVDNPVVTYLAGIRTVNLKKAGYVARMLGLENLEDLLTIKQSDLTKLKGIGDVTAHKIMRAITDE